MEVSIQPYVNLQILFSDLVAGQSNLIILLQVETNAYLIHTSICPGRHLAQDALFLTFASILAVFNISPALGEDGKPKTLDIDTSGDGILWYGFHEVG